MNVYVTGGTGFIGSYVVKALSSGGHSVVILAKNPDKVPALRALPHVRIVRADMHDFDALDREMARPDALVHIALCGIGNGPETVIDETLASVRLLELAAQKGTAQIIYTSSTAAVGYSLPVTDEESRMRPEDFYGASKGAVELFVWAYARKNPDIRFNVIRPGYTFGNPAVEGASMEIDSRFREICACAKANRPIELIQNDGTQFIWAGDLARLFRHVLESEVKNETFFGLGTRFVSWETIARSAIAACGSSSQIRLSDRGYSEKPYLFSVKKIEEHFGLRCDSAEEIRKHIAYLLGT